MELVIGTKAWSTWSMRPWLVLTKTGAAFDETLIPLRQENMMSAAAILAHSPSGLVPPSGLHARRTATLAIRGSRNGDLQNTWPSGSRTPGCGRRTPWREPARARRRRRCIRGSRRCAGECPRWTSAATPHAGWRCRRRRSKDIRRIVAALERKCRRAVRWALAGRGALGDRRRLLHPGGDAVPDLWGAFDSATTATRGRLANTPSGCWRGRSSWRGRRASERGPHKVRNRIGLQAEERGAGRLV